MVCEDTNHGEKDAEKKGKEYNNPTIKLISREGKEKDTIEYAWEIKGTVDIDGTQREISTTISTGISTKFVKDTTTGSIQTNNVKTNDTPKK